MAELSSTVARLLSSRKQDLSSLFLVVFLLQLLFFQCMCILMLIIEPGSAKLGQIAQAKGTFCEMP